VFLIILTVGLVVALYIFHGIPGSPKNKIYIALSSLVGALMLCAMNILTDLNINPYKAQSSGVYKEPDYIENYGKGDWILNGTYYFVNNFVFATIISIIFWKYHALAEPGGDYITMVTVFSLIGIFLNLTMRFQTDDYHNKGSFWSFIVPICIFGLVAVWKLLGGGVVPLAFFFIICMAVNMVWILVRGPTKIKYFLINKDSQKDNYNINWFPIIYSGLLVLLMIWIYRN
jgi:hypothetical protein